MLRWLLAAAHLLALGIGLGAVFGRGRAGLWRAGVVSDVPGTAAPDKRMHRTGRSAGPRPNVD